MKKSLIFIIIKFQITCNHVIKERKIVKIFFLMNCDYFGKNLSRIMKNKDSPSLDG